ncbi:MAG: site-specific integrase [Dechloromonas sp.]|uniref:Site-specific integrase n=1 Tax=Candidatus Dechloromonas phosphorivorans TaxID=2899244 RepID=A0A935JVN9_9RHOO|nr:site-specific integrase [Candidatus Dechloromonas phosphorivorans]
MNRTEIRHSLKTGNLREAAKLGAAIAWKYDNALRTLIRFDGTKMTPEQIRQLRELINSGGLSPFQIDYHQNGQVAKIQADPNNVQDCEFALEAHKIVVEAQAKQVEAPTTQNTPKDSPATLKGLIEDYIKVKSTPNRLGQYDKGWDQEEKRKERASAARVLLDLLGNHPISGVNKMMVERSWDDLKTLPPNWKKSPKWRGKSIEQIIEEQIKAQEKYAQQKAKLPTSAQRDALNQDDFVKYLSPKTLENYQWNWSALFQWAAEHDYVPRNFAESLKVGEIYFIHGRSSYTKDQLKQIFECEHYGTRTADDPAKYWVPLLLLYSGARLNEMCQLLVEDIIQDENIWSIRILEEVVTRKRLKSKQSRRVIPIHSKLIELGFLEYVEKRKKRKDVKLFPSLDTGDEKHNKYLGNWYGRFLSVVGVKERGLDAHSFRHTAVSVWLNNEVNEIYAASICGHGYNTKEDKKNDPQTFSMYGDPPIPSVLKKYVEMLEFGIKHQKYRGTLDHKVRIPRGKSLNTRGSEEVENIESASI